MSGIGMPVTFEITHHSKRDSEMLSRGLSLVPNESSWDDSDWRKLVTILGCQWRLKSLITRNETSWDDLRTWVTWGWLKVMSDIGMPVTFEIIHHSKRDILGWLENNFKFVILRHRGQRSGLHLKRKWVTLGYQWRLKSLIRQSQVCNPEM